MMEQVTVVYEQGVLRPLRPLSIPDNTQLDIQIISQESQETEYQQVLQTLLDAGLLHTALPSTERPISDAELRAAAVAIGADGPLSDDIIAEREGR
jgi:predicted DNA-binding antitoxin AbrB/MazE fold protein